MQRNIAVFRTLMLVLLASLFAGCANMNKTMENLGMGAHEEGTPVSDKQLKALAEQDASRDEVIAELGQPTQTRDNVLLYDYIKIPQFGANVNYRTVLVFENGRLDVYEKKPGEAESANPLLQKHGM